MWDNSFLGTFNSPWGSVTIGTGGGGYYGGAWGGPWPGPYPAPPYYPPPAGGGWVAGGGDMMGLLLVGLGIVLIVALMQ
jgi:hypothetical protein